MPSGKRRTEGKERRSFHTRSGLICLHCLLSLYCTIPPLSLSLCSFTVVGAWQVGAKHVCAALDKPADAHIKCSLARRVRCHMFPLFVSLSLLFSPTLGLPCLSLLHIIDSQIISANQRTHQVKNEEGKLKLFSSETFVQAPVCGRSLPRPLFCLAFFGFAI